MRICCPYCDRAAELVTGKTIYPRRVDLLDLKFWRCEPCGAYVGCHKAGAKIYDGQKRMVSDGTVPLGRLANATLRRLKQEAHAAFDPLWRSGAMTRVEAYAWLAAQLGVSVRNCHIGMMDDDGCRAVLQVVTNSKRRLEVA